MGLELVGGNKSHLAPLQTTINKGIRLFTGARLSTAIGPLLVETGIGSLLTRSLVSRVRLLERSVTKKTPNQCYLLWNRYWLTPQVRPNTVKQRHSFALMETLRTCGDSASLQKARKAIQIGILVDTHPFSVDRCILCDQQLLSTSIAHLVVECEQVTGHRIQSGLVPAIQKSRLRLLGRSTRSGCGECIYLAPRWSLKWRSRSEPTLVVRGLWSMNLWGTRHDNRMLAARLADFLQVAYRQYQFTLWQIPPGNRIVGVG
ncbi:hypothetical protein BASA60_003049 [Batrachochytrium salamandrivorans]|nr:hypothetical protein BASA60_003049 [Batrachochytrium salamandrivorans]